MALPDAAKTVGAIALIVSTAFGAVNHFQSKAEAAQVKDQLTASQKAIEQKAEKRVSELRAELLLLRVKQLNAKGRLSPDEKLERDLNLEQVKRIQAEKSP